MFFTVDTTDKITNAKIEKQRAEIVATQAKIADAEHELEQLEHKAARLTQSQSAANRKARTRRLIERGAIAENFIPSAETLTNDEFKAELKRLTATGRE
jgi:uncharacterized coiled-coil DUF342 family protein